MCQNSEMERTERNTRSQAHGLYSKNSMPRKDSKSALFTFRGKSHHLRSFLHCFECLAELHNLDSKAKCEWVVEYCSYKVQETIEGLTSHQEGDWTSLEKQIEEVYDVDALTTRIHFLT